MHGYLLASPTCKKRGESTVAAACFLRVQKIQQEGNGETIKSNFLLSTWLCAWRAAITRQHERRHDFKNYDDFSVDGADQQTNVDDVIHFDLFRFVVMLYEESTTVWNIRTYFCFFDAGASSSTAGGSLAASVSAIVLVLVAAVAEGVIAVQYPIFVCLRGDTAVKSKPYLLLQLSEW